MSIYDVFSGSKPFDKAEWAAQKQAQRKEAYELIDNTCLEMTSGGDAFRSYLEVQGRFDRYSVNNAILVSAQMPEATQLKEKAAWKANRVYVNKDAQKVIILEPGQEYTREDGSKAVGYPKATYHAIWQKQNGIYHPTVKSVEFLSWLIQISSTPRELVFDGFMGTGSTALAALRNSRDYLGAEIDREYFAVAQKRIKEVFEHV